MAQQMFDVVDNATMSQGVKEVLVYGCHATIEYEVKSLQTRGEWQLELRALNEGAAQYNLAHTPGNILYVAVGSCEPINLAEHAGVSASKQRELAATILHNLVRYGLTEIRVIKGHEEIAAIPMLGDRDTPPMEDTNDLGVDPPRRFHIYHYAPFVREGDSDELELSPHKETIEWY
jgi:hypothetical protein